MKIKFTLELMGYMKVFENVTKVKVKDCFEDDHGKLTFVVNNKDIGNAVGKNASNIKKLELKYKKKIRILAFNEDKITFIKNLIHPVKAENIEEMDGAIIIQPKDLKSRGVLIGRNASNLRNMESITKRYFDDVKEIKVTG